MTVSLRKKERNCLRIFFFNNNLNLIYQFCSI
jgi:hypothetical protein